jgi:uncharacterized protein YbcI
MSQKPLQDSVSHGSVNSVGSGAVVASISREIVGIYAEYFGRGPTKARTSWHEGFVLCVLEDVFTRAERVLIDGGRFEQVRLTRQAFQEEVEPMFREAVEKATGRLVEACLSQVNQAGIAAEVFLLGDPLPTALP